MFVRHSSNVTCFMEPGHKNTGTCHNNLTQDSRQSWCCVTCRVAHIVLPEQVNVKLNLVEREIVTHKLKKKDDCLIQLKRTLITVRLWKRWHAGIDPAWGCCIKQQAPKLEAIVFPNPQGVADNPRQKSSPKLDISAYHFKALLVWAMIITIFVIFHYSMLQFRQFGTLSASFTDPPAVKGSLQEQSARRGGYIRTYSVKPQQTRYDEQK